MMGIVHIMLIGVIAWAAAAADKTALLLDESAYAPEEFNCVSVAAKLAWKDASMSEFQSIEPSKLRNEIDHLEVKYNLMQRFLELHDLGFQKFVGVSSSALHPILELAESDVRFEKSRVFPLEPISLPSARQAKLLNVAVYESMPSLAEFYTVLLEGSCPSDHDKSSQVVIPFLVSNGTVSEELIASWNVALHKNMPSSKAQVEVTDPIFVGEERKLVSALMEAQKVGAEPHIFVLDGGKGIAQLLRLIKKHSSLKNLPLHIHSAMAMNFQSSFRNIIEREGNIILHTVEYVGQDWHAPARRRLFSRLGSAMLKDSGLIQHCPPSAALIYKLILDVAADEPESRDGELVTAFYQRKHLKKKGEPLAVIVQDSPWVWDGPKTACGRPARGAGGSPGPLAEMIFKPAIDSLVEQKLGSNCSQVEVSFNAYDPWQYTLVKRTYPLQKLPYLTMLANVGGFWIEASCFKANVTLAYSIACTPNSASNGIAVEGRFDHCSERLVEGPAASFISLNGQEQEQWKSRQNVLLKKVQEVVKAAAGPIRSKRAADKRLDLYGPAWIYQILNRRPGALTPILSDSAPNLLGCLGTNLGCMTCVFIRAATDRNTLGGCIPPCAANIGNACGNAWGVVLSKELAAKSVVCTELFKQGLIDAETFVADGQFGAFLEREDPLVLKGYRLLAGPFVSAAQQSKLAAKALRFLTTPFMRYMKYEQGIVTSWSSLGTVGWLGTEVGKPFCRLAGFVHENVPKWLESMSLFS